MVKKLLIVAVLLIVVALVGLALYIGPRNLIGLVTYGGQARDGDLQVGDRAPVVPLVALEDGSRRQLDEFVGDRPLVLVFGSFT